MLSRIAPAHLQNLRDSGLSDETIARMGIRSLSIEEVEKLTGWKNAVGYLIPYFDRHGKPLTDKGLEEDAEPIPFVRVRLFPPITTPDGDTVRYVQPKYAGTHLYVLPEVWSVANTLEPIVITEGEKKAAKSVQEGIPTIGLGGVDNWKRQQYRLLPTSVKQLDKEVLVSIKPENIRRVEEHVAPELLEFRWSGRKVYIVFDNDPMAKLSSRENVQRAAFELALWLHRHGAEVYQVVLPSDRPDKKVGLDDFLLEHSADEFWELADAALFPTIPNLRSWLQLLLDRKKSRSDILAAAKATVADLDHRGKRYKHPELPEYYFFDNEEYSLYDAEWKVDSAEFPEKSLAQYLKRVYEIGTSDKELLKRVADEFRQGVELVTPHNLFFARENVVYVAKSDSEFYKVTPLGVEVRPNGTDSVLFKRGFITEECEIDLDAVGMRPRRLWREVVNQLSLDTHPVLTDEEQRTLLELLCYLTPIFRNWRGLQLPLELAIGERGSGKTDFYRLRIFTFTGDYSDKWLKGQPSDKRDFEAMLVNSPGLLILDNVDSLPPELRKAVEVSLARIVTGGVIEMRTLYTTASVSRFHPETCVAITGIAVPVKESDVLQRSIRLYFKALEGRYDPDWFYNWSRRRKELLTDILSAACWFLQIADKRWKAGERSQLRLSGLERALRIMAEALDKSGEMLKVTESIIRKLPRTFYAEAEQADNALSTLRDIADYYRQEKGVGHRLSAEDICMRAWVELNGKEYPFENGKRLGWFLSKHRTDVEKIAGLKLVSLGNRNLYEILPKSES
ncbi:MAG TPA: DUF3854 domain-containing protein [Thermoanaerobacterales bacterium]|nr:DUF3854 domain-containing protein [Thermoanaerobacterales bacterium]